MPIDTAKANALTVDIMNNAAPSTIFPCRDHRAICDLLQIADVSSFDNATRRCQEILASKFSKVNFYNVI